MIRQADINDIRAVTRLHYTAGSNLLKFFFATDKETKLFSILEELYKTNENIFSKDNFLVFEEEMNVKGAISLYTVKEKKTLEANALRHIFKIYKTCGIIRLMIVIYRLIFYNLSPKFYSDELYIHAISVFHQYRGQKIASKLLSYALKQAKELNMPKIALLVEIQNEHAIKVYQKYGFKIIETQKFSSSLEKYKLYGIHKMVANIN